MAKHVESKTVRMLRIPAAQRVDMADTNEIPIYEEEDKVREDHWGEATGRVPPRNNESHESWMVHEDHPLTPDEIKARHISYMTAFCMWFALLCVAGVVSAFVVKLIGHILGV